MEQPGLLQVSNNGVVSVAAAVVAVTRNVAFMCYCSATVTGFPFLALKLHLVYFLGKHMIFLPFCSALCFRSIVGFLSPST